MDRFSSTSDERAGSDDVAYSVSDSQWDSNITSAFSGPLSSAKIETNSTGSSQLKVATADFSRIFDAFYKKKATLAQGNLKPDFPSTQRKILTDELIKIITDYSVAHGIDLVLDSSAGSLADAHVVAYSKPSLDITQEIISLENVGGNAN